MGGKYVLKKYRFGFDICGLVIFFLIMIPNFFCFVVPAPNYILRVESVTLVVDNIASIAQVVMVVGLCIFRNIGREKIRITNFIIVTTVCSSIYFLCWILYYLGITNVGVILGLTIFPCLAFLFYSFDRKNMFAFVPALIFMICHLVYAIINYIV